MTIPPSKKRRPFALRLLRGVLVTVAGAYVIITCALWFTQTRFLFHPSRVVDTTPGDLGAKFDRVTVPLGGDHLAGWWVPAGRPTAGTLLYLHGNAGNVAANAPQVLRLRKTGLNVFIFDYRGYGESTGGPPREKLLYADAERAWRYLVDERKIPPAAIAIYGHSLGAAVAVDLASHHPEAGALITEGALTSIVDRANESPYVAWLPIRLIVTERFDSLSKIGTVRAPKLFLQGAEDTMAPPQMARRLYDAAPEPKELAIIPGGGHEDSAEANPQAYLGALRGFLSRHALEP